MTACDLCSGTLSVAHNPSAPLAQVLGHVVDLKPCPRCLSIPPTQEIRDVAHESQFYPWETPGGNYTTGPAWWEPEEQVPLWLPMGLDLGVRVICARKGWGAREVHGWLAEGSLAKHMHRVTFEAPEGKLVMALELRARLLQDADEDWLYEEGI